MLRRAFSFISTRPRAAGFWAAGLAAAAAAQTWFRPGHHTAAGDVLPFVRDSLTSELFSLWNHQLSAAGGPSAEIFRIFDVVFIEAAAVAGLAAHSAQRLFYTFLAVAAALATAHMADVVCRSVFPASDFRSRPLWGFSLAAAGTLAVVNPYWMVLAPNPIFLAAVALAAASAAVIWSTVAGHPPRVSWVVLGAVCFTLVGTNPPLLAVLALWAVFCVFTAFGVLRPSGVEFFSACRRLALFGVSAVLVNLFWILPLWFTLTSDPSVVAAEVSAQAWSWSHAHNSPANIFGLNAFWGWSYGDEYIPYAARLDTVGWSSLRFALPTAALVSLVFAMLQRGNRPARRLAWVLAPAGVVVALVAKGLHEPFSQVNAFLYDHLPGMWLLREPMSKVGWALLFVYLLACTLAVAFLLSRPDGAKLSPRRRGLVAGAGTLVLLAALAYAHPVFSGEAVPERRGRIPGAYVSLPADLPELVSAVDELDPFRVVSLPHPTFYQMGHSWGYYGVDQVLQQAISRPVVSLASGGYFAQPPVFVALAEEASAALLARDSSTALNLFSRLGVDTLILRFDFDAGVSQPGLVDPHLLADALADLGFTPSFSSELFQLYDLGTPPPVRMFSDPQLLVLSGDSSSADWVAAGVSAPWDAVILPSNGLSSGLDLPSDASNPISGASRISVVSSSPSPLPKGPLRFSFSTAPTRAAFTLSPDGVLSPAVRLNLSYQLSNSDDPASRSVVVAPPSMGLDLPAPTDVVAFRTSDGLLAPRTDGSFTAAPGEQVELFTAAGSWLRFSLRSVVSCSALNRPSGVSCLRGSLRNGVSSGTVLISVNLRDVATQDVFTGRRVELCLGSPVDPCVEALASHGPAVSDLGSLRSDSSHPPPPLIFSWVVDLSDLPAPVSSATFISPVDLPAGASVSFTPLASAGLLKAELPPSVEASVPTSSGDTVGFLTHLDGLSTRVSPGMFSGLEDCNRVSAQTSAADLSVSRRGDTVTLSAQKNSACVWANLGPVSSPAVRLSLEFSSTSGQNPRICLWQTAVSRCAAAQLSGRDGFFDEVVSLDTSLGEVLLFLYADSPAGAPGLPTVTSYTNISVTPHPGLVATATPADLPSTSVSTPELMFGLEDLANQSSTGVLFSAVLPRDLPAGSLVYVSEAFSPHIELRSPDGVVDAFHLEADGWANGWVLSETLEAGTVVTVVFTAELLADVGLWVSAVVLLAALVGLLAGPAVAGFNSPFSPLLRRSSTQLNSSSTASNAPLLDSDSADLSGSDHWHNLPPKGP